MTERELFIQSVKHAREAAAEIGEDYIPVLQSWDNDALLGMFGLGYFDNQDDKQRRFMEALFMHHVMGGTSFRFAIDALYLTLPKDEVPDGEPFPLPSERPESKDAIMVFEYEGGKRIALELLKYHISDDGIVVWEGHEQIDPEAEFDSWMTTAAGLASKNPPEKVKDSQEVINIAKWYDARGNVVIYIRKEAA